MTAIYHITHLRNLQNILRDGGLWCDHIVEERNLAHVSIAYQHIKDRRARKQVPCGPGGTVSDYVPFYFAPRSPMLYVINRRMMPVLEPIMEVSQQAQQISSGRLATGTKDKSLLFGQV